MATVASLMYELPHELPKDLRLRKKGNIRKILNWAETQPSAQSPFQKLNFSSSSQKTRKSRYQTFLVLSSFTGCLYFVPNILPRIVGIKFHLKLITLIFWIKFAQKVYFRSKVYFFQSKVQPQCICLIFRQLQLGVASKSVAYIKILYVYLRCLPLNIP